MDLRDVFRGSGREADELYFAGDRPWTGTGNRVAGEALADFLRARVPGTPGASRQVGYSGGPSGSGVYSTASRSALFHAATAAHSLVNLPRSS